MEESQWITLIVGLLTIAGTLIAAHWQLRRDGKSIDGISSDTAEMKPAVQKIDENTSKIRDVVVESLSPSMADIRSRNSKIDFIASELEFQKRLQQDLPKDDRNRDSVLAEIRSVYERNAALNAENKQLLQQVFSLMAENSQLHSQVAELNAELQREQQKNSGRDMSDDLEMEP